MIFISGNTPSSKNSKVWTGKFLVNSASCTKYIKETKQQWLDNKESFLKQLNGKDKPYYLGMYFVRKSMHKADYNNCSQIVCDLMKKYEWIEDDNMYEIVPVFLGFHVDKEKPGVYLKVLDGRLLKNLCGYNLINDTINNTTESVYSKI
jgi:hypothetical protein